MCFGPSSDLWVFALLFNRKLCSNCHLACSPWDTQWLLREMHFIINVNLYVFMTLLGGRGRQRFPGDICSFLTIYCPRQSKNNDKHCYRKWRVPQWHFWRERRGGWSGFHVFAPLQHLQQLHQIEWRSGPYGGTLSPHACPFLGPAMTLCSVLCCSWGGTEEGQECVFWEASSAKSHKTQSECSEESPCPLALVVSDLLLSDLAWKPCACSSSCKTSNQTVSRKARVCDIIYQSIISIFFLSLLQSSSVIHTATEELWEGMKMVGLGCIGEPKHFSLQGHPKKEISKALSSLWSHFSCLSQQCSAGLVKVKVRLLCTKASKAFVLEGASLFPLGYPPCNTTSQSFLCAIELIASSYKWTTVFVFYSLALSMHNPL